LRRHLPQRNERKCEAKKSERKCGSAHQNCGRRRDGLVIPDVVDGGMTAATGSTAKRMTAKPRTLRPSRAASPQNRRVPQDRGFHSRQVASAWDSQPPRLLYRAGNLSISREPARHRVRGQTFGPTSLAYASAARLDLLMVSPACGRYPGPPRATLSSHRLPLWASHPELPGRRLVGPASVAVRLGTK
jgi:hypothetical protein